MKCIFHTERWRAITSTISAGMITLGLLAAPALAGAQQASTPPANPTPRVAAPLPPEEHPDSLLVGFKPQTLRAARGSIHKAAGTRQVHSFRYIPVDVVRLVKTGDRAQVMEAYRRQPEVAYVEPNYRRAAIALPNDTRFAELWGMHNTGQSNGAAGADIAVTSVWDTTTGSANVLVAVIDTGIDYNHPDLADNIWSNPAPTFGDVHGARWTGGYGEITSGDPMDGDGHGTHCAGTIGGVGDNSLGVAGVNWTVRMMGLKFLDDSGSGYDADAIAAIEYAIAKGARVSNNSWGGGPGSQALEDAILAANAAGQLFVAAAGNSATDNDATPHYPSSFDCANILAVASSDRNDTRSWFSCYGHTSVDLAAPGSGILSTVPGSSYDIYSGTSMATPHVTGAAALLLSLYGTASPAFLKSWLMQGVDTLPAWQGYTVTGGRMNVAESFRLAEESWVSIIRLAGDMNFGDIMLGQTAQRTLTIYNDGAAPLSVAAIAFPDGFSGNWGGGAINGGMSKSITVTFRPERAGDYAGTITVNSDADSGGNTRACAGVGVYMSVIRLDGDLGFETLLLGQSAQRTLTIYNDGNALMNVTALTFPNGFSGNWTGGTVIPGCSRAVAVTFTPTQSANYSGTITVYSDAGAGDNTHTCSGAGLQLQPPSSLSASSGTYSDQIELRWTLVAEARSYRLWRSTTPNWNTAGIVTEIGTNVYSDTETGAGRSYYYWVTSRNVDIVSAPGNMAAGWRRSNAASRNSAGDFDGDGRMDIAVYQEATGTWLINLSASGYTTISRYLGGPGWRPASGDYDGDGITDLAVYAPGSGAWQTLLSRSGQLVSAVLGGAGFDAVPSDYDGDGKTDPAVYHTASGLWMVQRSAGGYAPATLTLGGTGFTPIPADYDADGRGDPAVYQPQTVFPGWDMGYWAAALSGRGYAIATGRFGDGTQIPTPADYNGNRHADLAVYRQADGMWSVSVNGGGASVPSQFVGGAGFVPVPADYDGDGKDDLAVYQESTGLWLARLSGSGYAIVSTSLGGPGYVPVVY